MIRRVLSVSLLAALVACGAPAPDECTTAADCAGEDTACAARTCNAGVCGVSNVAAGTPVADQNAGDCRRLVCDGDGNVSSVRDDTDLPDDGNPCTDNRCEDGEPAHPPRQEGTACGSAENMECDGAGVCVGCSAPEECPGEDGACGARTCVEGACGFTFADEGTVLDAQTAGDCQRAECDGAGSVRSVNDDDDLPEDDNPCTENVCYGGVPSHPPADARTDCGNGMCDGAGVCVGCVDASDCPGEDDECRNRTCDDGVCGAAFADAGTPLSSQQAGDCQRVECDGEGGTRSVNDDGDLPDDDDLCTRDICTAGVPSNPPADARTLCDDGLCDGEGACVECLAPTDCEGQDGECAWRTCAEGACGTGFAETGTPLAAQTEGDCLRRECDGSGGTREASDDEDLPDDDNECTDDVCIAGEPSHPPFGSDVTCADGAMACNGAGACVGCTVPGDCPGTDTECRVRTCDGGACGFAFTNAGFRVSSQQAGDCRVNECNGTGGVRSVADDEDLPADGNECTAGSCSAGAPSHDPVAPGVECTQDGGAMCNGNGSCVECLSDEDCDSGVCTDQWCAEPACDDGVRNGDETDVDCGGSCTACVKLAFAAASGDGVLVGVTDPRNGDYGVQWIPSVYTWTPPSVAADPSGRVIAVWAGENGALRHTHWSAGAWSAAADVGPGVTTRATPSLAADGQIQVAFQGDDWQHYHASFDGSWSGPAGTGLYGPSAPSLAAHAGAATLLFFNGSSNNDLFSVVREDGQWGEATFRAGLTGWALAPTVIALPDGDLLAAYTGGDTSIWTIRRTAGEWTAPFAVPDGWTSATIAIAPSSGAGAVLAFRGGDGNVYASTLSGSTWSGPVRVAENVTGAPALAAGADGADVDLLYVVEGRLQHRRLADGTWGQQQTIGGEGLFGVAAAVVR